MTTETRETHKKVLQISKKIVPNCIMMNKTKEIGQKNYKLFKTLDSQIGKTFMRL